MQRLRYGLYVCVLLAVLGATSKATTATLIIQNQTHSYPSQMYSDNTNWVLTWYYYGTGCSLWWRWVGGGGPHNADWLSAGDAQWGDYGLGSHQNQWGADGSHVVMQADGNFVLYNYDYSAAVWATGTSTGTHVALQDDGNLVVYDSTPTPLWSLFQ